MRFLNAFILTVLIATRVNTPEALSTELTDDPMARLIKTCKAGACKPEADEVKDVDRASRGVSSEIPLSVWQAMQGKSWHRKYKCPPKKTLRLLEIPYRDFNGNRQTGKLIVAKDVAEDLLTVFEKLYVEKFPIARMELVHTFNGNDNRSMAKNNTSAFNCRLKTSRRSLSEHSYGRAVDINPVQNPYVRRGKAQPSKGRKYIKGRREPRKGMIRKGDVVVRAFRNIGWSWGGDWRSVKDYQHFSATGK